jgi:glycosyltransferase involved in cell wall biosynthesis
LTKIGWISASPIARTGYGRETREIGYRLVDAGVEVVFIGSYGDVIIWGGVTEQYTFKGKKVEILALTHPGSAPDVVMQYAQDYDLQLLVGFMDCFGLEFLNYVKMPVIGYIPIDSAFTQKMYNYLREYYKIVAFSKFGYAELKKWYPESKIGFIEHGVDTDLFNPLNPTEYDEAREWLLKEYGIPKDAFLAVDCGANMGPRKELPLLMRTFSRMKSKNTHLFLFTNAYAPQSGYDLIAHRINLKMQDRIHFPKRDPILFPASDEELRKIYGAAQVFAHTAVAEGRGLPMAEAMSMGIPPIGPDNSAQTELIKGRGWLVKNVPEDMHIEYPVYVPTLQEYPVPDQKILLACLEHAYEHPDLRKKYGKRCRRYALENFAWNKVIPQWLELFRRFEQDLDFIRAVHQGLAAAYPG